MHDERFQIVLLLLDHFKGGITMLTGSLRENHMSEMETTLKLQSLEG